MKTDIHHANRSRGRTALGLSGLALGVLTSTAALATGVSLLYASEGVPDSFIPDWLVRPLAVVGAATVGGSSGLPVVVDDVDAAQTDNITAGAGAIEVPPLRLGINISSARYWHPARLFMNLAAGGGWSIVGSDAGSEPREDQVDADGNIISLDAGTTARRQLNMAPRMFAGASVDILCRWKGKGTLSLANGRYISNSTASENELRFTYLPRTGASGSGTPFAIVIMSSVDRQDPVRELDCREPNADPKALVYPDFIKSMNGIDTMRFMDVMKTNRNEAVTWATRARPTSANLFGPNGYPAEHVIALANAAKSNAWINMPWNADDDYIRRFAKLTRATLDPTLKVHVELSNELWNTGFPVNWQAQTEGLAEGLAPSTKSFLAGTLRYAERTKEVMQIWTEVFKGQESRLVRVVGVQNGSTSQIKAILTFRDTAEFVDAIAVAPYFKVNIDNVTDDPASVQAVFDDMKARIDNVINNNIDIKEMAISYGKRLICYEGGQHLVSDNLEFNSKLQNDRRMGQLYTYYFTQWQKNFGDLMVTFMDVDEVSKYGAWGQAAYLGQPLKEAPKAKAYQLFLRSLGQ